MIYYIMYINTVYYYNNPRSYYIYAQSISRDEKYHIILI